MKRIFDIVVSFVGLVVSAPILLPVMFLIWRQDGHSPFYIADRVGSNGITFKMLKLRSMVKSADKVYGGSYISLTNPIDFSSKKTFSMKVYSPRVGAKVLLKVENLTNANLGYEKESVTTKANTWETLSFDYSAVPTTNAYQKVVLIFDNGTMGDGSANFTFYFDDITLN